MFNQKNFENLPEKKLDKKILNTCYIKNEDVIECCICLEPTNKDYIMNCCSQKIHELCLKKWSEKDYNLNQISKCPICWTDFDNKDLFQISLYKKIKNIFCDCNITKNYNSNSNI